MQPTATTMAPGALTWLIFWRPSPSSDVRTSRYRQIVQSRQWFSLYCILRAQNERVCWQAVRVRHGGSREPCCHSMLYSAMCPKVTTAYSVSSVLLGRHVHSIWILSFPALVPCDCKAPYVLDLSNGLDQEYLIERETMLQNS